MKFEEGSTNQDGPILIFPGGMPRSIEFLKKCQSEGKSVLGASSLPFDTAREQYANWVFLPYITDDNFEDALKEVVTRHGVQAIYSPNPVAWNHLDRILSGALPGIELVNQSPVTAELDAYRYAVTRAVALLDKPLPLLFGEKPTLPVSQIELGSLYRHFEVIPGMCDHEKLRALHEIVRNAVPGDIVEIGSWWGKSAFLLSRLGSLYGVGKLLCIDPWSDAHLVQNDEGGMVDAMSAQFKADEAFHIFLMNLLPYSAGNVNYLRMPSTDGAAVYRDNPSIASDAFGDTVYGGRISILHIDGNHAYEAARDDISAWAPLVMAGGWIVVDDYVWPYGDGPQRAGDEFIDANRDSIDNTFVMGGALFIRLSKALMKTR